MDSEIKIKNTTLIRGEDQPIEFEVVDENDQPVDGGKTVVKLNKKTVLRGEVVEGKFSAQLDFDEFKNEEYDLDIIYGGNDECDPTDYSAKLYIRDVEFVDIPSFDLQNANYRLTRWIDVNKKLPGKIAIADKQIPVGHLLFILASAVKDIDVCDCTSISTYQVANPKVSSENLKENITLTKEEYIKVADEIIQKSQADFEAPKCVMIDAETKIGFMNLIYSFAKIVANSSTNSGLISEYTIRPWNDIVKK